jgi:raffinose synthase
MFHSKHPSAYLHGAARAVSGGMVYVSDKPNEHDANLLRRLVLKDGSVLRASQAGVPTRDCLFTDVGRDGVSALKIWNVNDKSSIGLVGAFNVQGVQWDFDAHENVINDKSPRQVEAVIRAEDVEIFREMSGRFVAYSHRSQMLSLLDTCTAEIKLKLQHREWELVSISPMHEVGQISFSPIGLVDMFNSGGAITSMQIDNSSLRVELSCKGSGRFLVYSSCRPFEVTLSDVDQQQGPAKVLPFEYNPKSGELVLMLLEEVHDTHRLIFQWT